VLAREKLYCSLRTLITYFSRIFLLVVALVGVACSHTEQPYIKVEGQMLGTFMQVSARTSRSSAEVYSLMMQIDSMAKLSMSIFDEQSLLSRLNNNLTDEVDEHIAYCLDLSRRVSEQSGGLYDVTVAPLVEAYGFAAKDRQVKVNVDSLLDFVGIDKLRIEDGRLVKTDDRVRIDFNSIAKGYVVDMAARALEEWGMTDYLVDIGGEVRCSGVNAKGGAWRVGVETPFDGNNTVGAYVQQVISLSNCSMATSGNYRRYYLDDEGRKVAHTIDPRTGRSAVTQLLSATVVAPTCAEADAYGTMFMAMPLEQAIATARELEKQGVQAYFIAAGENDEFEVYYTKGLADALAQTDGYRAI
jgi:thiamine biosynthesis lipoprotein